MTRLFFIISLIVSIFTDFLFGQNPKVAVDNPISVQFVRAEKPPENSNKDVSTMYVELKVNNSYDLPVWYILPNFADNFIPENGKYEAMEPWRRNYISGMSFFDSLNRREDGKPKRFVLIHFIGKKNGFYAFRVPARSSLTLSAYPFDTWKEVEEVEIWEAEKLMINDELAMEDFLMYETLASPDAVVQTMDIGFYNVDWKEDDLVTAASKTEIKYVQLTALSKKKYPVVRR